MITRAKAQRAQRNENGKLEVRNPKQIQMTKKQKILNEPVSDFDIWI